MTGRRSAALVFAGVVVMALVGACQSAAAARPAVLMRADPATMDHVKAQLAKAMGRAQIELGPGDPTQSPKLSVLPPQPGPLEDRSLAKPTLFRLEIEGGACSLVREDTGVRTALAGVDCRALAR